ncbi:MAG: hypothetical protein JRE23_00280 [Deltaproteobacteria bacterium]|nr:hypothetical protein [Deltaproteobacteria bacterium]
MKRLSILIFLLFYVSPAWSLDEHGPAWKIQDGVVSPGVSATSVDFTGYTTSGLTVSEIDPIAMPVLANVSSDLNTLEAAFDIHTGVGHADMAKSMYDPNAKNGDAFDADNHDHSIIGSPTYSSIQDSINVTQSAGWISGGGITDLANGTVDVAAGTGLIRAIDSDVADLKLFDWSLAEDVALTDNVTNYIYVEYNAGSPQVAVDTSERTDFNTAIQIAIVSRSGNELHINEAERHTVGNATDLTVRRFKATAHIEQASGGIIGETGTRNISVTAGDWWEGLTNFQTVAFDSSTSIQTFDKVWYQIDSFTNWTTLSNVSQIDNSNYNDGDGLVSLSGPRYGVHWVYMETDGHVEVVYGQGDYTLSEAQDAAVVDNLPSQFNEHAFIIGKIIIKSSEAAFTTVESAFETEFKGSQPTDHGNLLGLSDDDHPQYVKTVGDTITGDLTVEGYIYAPAQGGNLHYSSNPGTYQNMSTEDIWYTNTTWSDKNTFGNISANLSNGTFSCLTGCDGKYIVLVDNSLRANAGSLISQGIFKNLSVDDSFSREMTVGPERPPISLSLTVSGGSGTAWDTYSSLEWIQNPDTDVIKINEAVGGSDPDFILETQYNVDIPYLLTIYNSLYDGGHTIKIRSWNYDIPAWVNLRDSTGKEFSSDVPDAAGTDFFRRQTTQYEFPPNANDFVSGGIVKIQYYHTGAGLNADSAEIDAMRIRDRVNSIPFPSHHEMDLVAGDTISLGFMTDTPDTHFIKDHMDITIIRIGDS